MFLKVIEAFYLKDYQIFVRFNNDQSGVINLENTLTGEIFLPLKEKDFFKSFQLNDTTLEWSNGADFAPEFLIQLLEQPRKNYLVSSFYGVTITMALKPNQHHSPHFHANYDYFDALFNLPDGELIDGIMPNKPLKLIQAWVSIHQEELQANWRLLLQGESTQPIKGLS